MRRKQTSLVFKEAHLDADGGSTFEDLLKIVGKKLPTVADRIVNLDLYTKIVVAEVVSTINELTFARLVELDEGATGLLNLDAESASAQIEAMDAPDQRRFVRSEAFVLVGGNRVITVGVKNKAGTYMRSLLELAEKCGVNETFRRTVLVDVANDAELTRIRKIGVKSVEFSITGYLADIDPDAISKIDSNVLKRMLKRPMSEDDRRKTAKSRGKVILTRGDIRSESVSTDEWLDEVAVAAFKETEGYKIQLANNEIVKENMLKVSTSVAIRTHANSLHAGETRLAMENYWFELRNRGLVP